MRFLLTLFICLLFSFLLEAQEIPLALQEIGFTETSLVAYEVEDNVEYFTFLDSETPELWDTITFIVENGEVIDWFRQEYSE